MKCKRILLLLIIIINCLSCSKPSTQKGNSSKSNNIIFNDIPEYKGLRYSDLFDSINLIKLETCEECLIGRIDKLVYYDNKIFIMDQVQSKAVYVFDNTGKFLTRIGRNGKGPGEYLEPNDIAIDQFNNKIVIWNNNGKNLLFYELDGRFFEEIKLDFFIKSVSILRKDVYAVYFDFAKDKHTSKISKYNLLVINKNDQILNKAFPLDRFSKGGINFFSLNSENLLISPGYSNQIYQISNNGSAILKYTIDFGEYTISNNYMSVKSKKEFNNKLKTDNIAFLNKFFENDKYFIFSFICKSKVYTSYYSKQTGNLFFANLFINDIFGLISGGSIQAATNDFIISSIDLSNNIEEIKSIYNKSKIDGIILKDEMLKRLKNINIPNDELHSYMKLLETSNFNPTEEEKIFINSIYPTDNPIIIYQFLKTF